MRQSKIGKAVCGILSELENQGLEYCCDNDCFPELVDECKLTIADTGKTSGAKKLAYQLLETDEKVLKAVHRLLAATLEHFVCAVNDGEETDD